MESETVSNKVRGDTDAAVHEADSKWQENTQYIEDCFAPSKIVS